MKIAFVSANREHLPEPVVPIGLLHVMACAPSHHDKQLLDLGFSRVPLETLRLFLIKFKPDLVAVGLRNLQNADYSGTANNLDYYKSLLQTIRSAANAKIVLGGGGFSVAPESVMKILKPDFGIAGEGENSFASLLEALDANVTNYEEIPLLFYYREGQLLSTSRAAKLVDLNKIQLLPRHLIEKQYYLKTGIESIQTKRGCALRCSYCTYPKIEGKTYRLKEPARVVDEMWDALGQNPEIKHFFFVDSAFNLPKTHAKDICKELIRQKWKTPWTCYANPLGFDTEGVKLMAAAGCVGLEIGSDSGCNEILSLLQKGFTTSQILSAGSSAKEFGLKDCHTFIVGTTGETIEHVKRTLEFITKLNPYAAILMVWMDDDECFDSALAKERQIFRAQILALLEQMKDHFPHWIIPCLNVNFDPKRMRALKLLGYHGPAWQHIRAAGLRA